MSVVGIVGGVVGGIVPPWLDPDTPVIFGGVCFPVLPLPPLPSDWSVDDYGPPVDDGIPDPDDRDFPWQYSFGYPNGLPE